MTPQTNHTAIHAPFLRRQTSLFGHLSALNALWRQRKTLSELDSLMLEDIGVPAEMAKNEANRPFWDIPSHWKG